MMNKKGTLVLRDLMFILLIIPIIFILVGFFVSDMATNYENTEMGNEWAGSSSNTTSSTLFETVGGNMTETGDDLSDTSTGFWSMIESGLNSLKGLGKGFVMVLFAPDSLGKLASGALQDIGVPFAIANFLRFFIELILWSIIIFTIYSAFLKGGKL